MSDKAVTPHDLRAERRALILWGLQARTYHHALQLIQTQLEQHNLTVMEFDILAHIAHDPSLTQQQLAERLLVTKGNVTYQLSKLEQQGLVERHSSGRCNHLHLTPHGQQLARQVIPGQNALHVQRFAHLTIDEQDQLATLLRKTLHPSQRR